MKFRGTDAAQTISAFVRREAGPQVHEVSIGERELIFCGR